MLNREERKFVRINKEYWDSHSSCCDSKSIILVEGQLMRAPNYLLRASVSAKAVQNAIGGKIVVISNCSKELEKKIKKLCGAFGIRDFININKMEIPLKVKIKSILKCMKIFFKNQPDQILNFSYDGINMGHLIYDDILHDDVYNKSKTKHYTIKRIDIYCIKHLYSFLIKAYSYHNILKNKNVSAYVSTHTVYTDYGILPFLAVKQHIPVVYSDDFSYAIIRNNEDLYAHNRIRGKIIEIINLNDKGELIRKAEKSMQKRMSGCGNIDTQLAFSNDKKSYSRDELLKKLGIHNQNPIVFIFAHVFRDSPHISTKMIYRDYYDWLKETLMYVNNINGVNWVLKEHPAGEKIYKEFGVAKGLLKKQKLKNIFICPTDFNTNSIKQVADAVITCQGTIGIECSCWGVPVVVCGNAFYTGFGFTIEPKNIKQYKEILLKINHIKKLKLDQIEKAKMVYAAYLMYYGDHLSLLSNNILEYIWGYNFEQDIQEAYRLINKQFDDINFIDSELYQEIYKYFKDT